MNTVAFWLFLIAVIFMVGRYSDTIMSNVRRLFASNADEDELRALKLSGGDDENS